MDTYDGISIGDYISELYFKQNLVNSDAFNNLYRLDYKANKNTQDIDVLNIGKDDVSSVFEVVKAGTVLIQAIGQEGNPNDVSLGFGLGIRQHDDVMLAYGYSRATRHEYTVPANNFQIIRLNVNGVNQHHVEERLLNTRTESVQLKVYDVTGQENLFPANPQPMPIFNQKGAFQETPNPSGEAGVDLLGEFFYYAPVAADPFVALTPIDDIPLWIASQNPANTRPDQFPAAKGRHYQPNRTYAVVIENLDGSETDGYYQYDWHEY